MTDKEMVKIKGYIFEEMDDDSHKELSYYERRKFVEEYIDDYIKRRNVICEKEEIDELISKSFIISNNENVIVAVGDGYTPWLDKKKNTIMWEHRDIYNRFLIEKKKWEPAPVCEIDKMSDIVLDHIADPTTDAFSKKGLVIGDVQSGKTSNYTALINKALDSGYKLIIILAGVHNDLRSQTQTRMDEQVIGYDSDKMITHEKANVGIGKLAGYDFKFESLTNKKKDYKFINMKTLSSNASIPIIAIVKKNTKVLDDFLTNINMNLETMNKDKLDISTLIIDDEVDQATVSTKKPEEDPTKINGLIRKIYNSFSKVSYVGYTATPYANILINDTVENSEFGKDLFPKDFILVIPTPDDYCGVREFFGDKQEDVRDDLISIIDDDKELCENEYDKDIKRVKFKSSSEITSLNGSIKDAINDFIVASAVRRTREGKVHNGMMIHIAAFKHPAECLTELVDDYIREIKISYLRNREANDNYKHIWETRFRQISINRGFQDDDWELIVKEIPHVVELLKVKLLNGTSKDVVDYTDLEESQIIAVGGNKLSRGITLEGLMITYYLRTPNAYDTAMQMGRWFGYKKNYLDLCRIYTKEQMIKDFIHIYDAMEELKDDITTMNAKDLNPTNFGLKIKTHPSMQPTARNKMRSALKMKVSFSEEREETIHFDEAEIDNNKKAAMKMMDSLSKNYNMINEEQKIIFRNVDSKVVLEFLKDYHSPSSSYVDKTTTWRNYISKVNKDDELREWTIVFNSLKNENSQGVMELGQYILNKGRRKALNSDLRDVRVITGKEEFKYFFDKDDPNRDKYKNGYEKNDEELVKLFNKKKGLMIIYPLDLDLGLGTKEKLEDVLGIGIWFPKTDSSQFGEYVVNQAYLHSSYEEEEEEEEEEEN